MYNRACVALYSCVNQTSETAFRKELASSNVKIATFSVCFSKRPTLIGQPPAATADGLVEAKVSDPTVKVNHG